MKKIITSLALAAMISTPAFAEEHKHDDHSGHKHESHEGHDHGDHKGHDHGKSEGGKMFEVGEGVAELELIHDEKAETVTINVFKEGEKTPLKIEKAPRLNITLKSSRKQVKTKAIKPDSDNKASTFTAKNELFKSEFNGEISIKIDGKSYKVKLADCGGHEGHDH